KATREGLPRQASCSLANTTSTSPDAEGDPGASGKSLGLRFLIPGPLRGPGKWSKRQPLLCWPAVDAGRRRHDAVGSREAQCLTLAWMAMPSWSGKADHPRQAKTSVFALCLNARFQWLLSGRG